MSRWDDLSQERERLASERGLASDSMNYSLFFPSDSERIWRMLIFDEKNIWNVEDFYDLSCFVEAFVLYEHIGIPGRLSGLLGPYIIEHFAEFDNCPTFDFSGQLTDAYEKHDAPDTQVFAEQMPYLVLNIALFALENNGKSISEYNIYEPYNRWIKYNLKVARLCPVPIDEKLDKPIEVTTFSNLISSWFCELGISFAPGYQASQWFQSHHNFSLSHKLYNEVTNIHEEHFSLIKKWTLKNQIFVPPLLTILLSRCSTRRSLLKNIILLRCEFEELRLESIKINKEIMVAKTIREKLELVWELEKARETIKKGLFDKKYRSIIKRTWDIVKTGSFSKAAIKLADCALQWDEERILVGGLRHFTNLGKKALNAPDTYKHLNQLFGEIKT